MKATTDRILFNVPKHIKDEFRESCEGLGMSMSHVLIGMMVKFTQESKQSSKKQQQNDFTD